LWRWPAYADSCANSSGRSFILTGLAQTIPGLRGAWRSNLAYDPAGNRLSRAETTPAQHGTTVKTAAYTYDAIYQLTQAATNGSTTDSYTYDDVGNRLTDWFGGTYSYDSSNELTSYPGYSWTYDNNGNTTSKTVSGLTTSYNWDFENRLTSVTLPGTGGTVTFKYDPFGRRIEKISPAAGTTIYAYDGDNVVEQLNASGAATARYTQGLGIDEPMEVYEGGKSYYYHADGLGSIVALTKSTGTAANTYFGYNTFGGMPAPSETVANPFRFTGRDYDSETGLYYYRARYYDSLFGRFLSEDPLGFSSQLANLYQYVFNNPVRWTDPSGLKVYRCHRHAYIYIRGVDVNVVNAYHYWIRTDTKEAGLGPARGGVPGHGGSDYPGIPTTINDHSGEGAKPGAECEEVPNEDENCVNKELAIGQNEGRFLILPPGRTCGNVVSDILDKCSTKPRIKIPFNPANPSGGFGFP
jgi:RHS repeat-associated protein